MKTPIEWNELYYNTDGIGLIELIMKVQQEAFEQGKQEGYYQGHKEGFFDAKHHFFEKGHLKGWNEALYWAAARWDEDYDKGLEFDKYDILNGLKQEEEEEAVSERSKLLNCKFCKSENVYRYTCGNMVGFAKCKDCKKEFEI